ncbi:MAG: hypothetical protein ABFS86_21180 [Planctomycetota bacterium]
MVLAALAAPVSIGPCYHSSMRLIAAAIVVAAVIVVVGLRPRGGGVVGSDGKPLPDVVWTDDEPLCPHCRTDVNWYSSVCYTCSHEYRWVPDEMPCDSCVDAARLRRFAKGLEDRDELRRALAVALDRFDLPEDVIAATVPDLVLYVESMTEGACAFCAGTGRRIAPATVEARAEDGDSLFVYAVETLGDACPVCLGTGRCIACGGDRKVEHGSEEASLEASRLNEELSDFDPGFTRENAERHFKRMKAFFERFAGTGEIADMSSLYTADRDQLEWALMRLETVLDALPEGD